jgi:hypothetical protein
VEEPGGATAQVESYEGRKGREEDQVGRDSDSSTDLRKFGQTHGSPGAKVAHWRTLTPYRNGVVPSSVLCLVFGWDLEQLQIW